jgi:ribosomal protein S18 acetylase RimI-like enzyme
MDKNEILARADANYFRSWSLLTSGTPGHELVEQDGLLLTSGQHNYAAFNLAYLWRSGRSPEERLGEVREYFARKSRPYFVRFRAGGVPGIEKALAVAGFVPADEADVPAMVHTGLASAAPSGALRIVTCRTTRELATWSRVMSAGYSIPEALARSFTAPVSAGLLDYELYLGYAGRVAVATSGLVFNNGVAGVYLVSTLPEHRRHGYGEQMTLQAMHRGYQRGALLASLQSSVMGQPIYRRMGFREAGSYRTYRPAPSVL